MIKQYPKISIKSGSQNLNLDEKSDHKSHNSFFESDSDEELIQTKQQNQLMVKDVKKLDVQQKSNQKTLSSIQSSKIKPQQTINSHQKTQSISNKIEVKKSFIAQTVQHIVKSSVKEQNLSEKKQQSNDKPKNFQRLSVAMRGTQQPIPSSHGRNKSISLSNQYIPPTKITASVNEYQCLSQAGLNDQGEQKVNQDNYLVEKNLFKIENTYLFAVFDGHGSQGEVISQYVKETLLKNLNKCFEEQRYGTLIEKIEASIKESFKVTTNNLEQSQMPSQKSGCTTCAVIIYEKHIFCANLGDSRAILCQLDEYEQPKVVQLSQDHKPSIKKEKDRILAHNGIIHCSKNYYGEEFGPLRVWLNNGQMGLCMTRCFGDTEGKQIGIISIPDIMHYTIKSDDKFIVIASDGLWDFLSNEEIVREVNKFYEQKEIKDAINNLLNLANQRWKKEIERDDITIQIIFLN